MRLFLFFLLLALPSASRACLWDSDTLETEVKGMPGVLEIIVGRFPRNPSLYYEMRLARVAKEVQSQPQKLELYDDAGVACDRLHRGDEAIAWMTKKRVQLDKLGFNTASKEHWYRYHANLGTFQAHKWLRGGANRKNIAEMKTGRDNIKRAIQINPDAHFGREKYQLMAMEWIIKAPKDKYLAEQPGFVYPPIYGDSQSAGILKNAAEARDAIKGLAGLIVLGNAWESVDVFASLCNALLSDGENRNNGDSSIAYMAKLRAIELVDEGKSSLAPRASKNVNILKARLGEGVASYVSHTKPLDKQFKELRAESDSWQNERTAYMMARLEKGQHPDTHPDFWNEWSEPEPPAIYGTLQPNRWRPFAVVGGALVLSLSLLGFAARKRKRRVIN
jgi:hypothetical protein